MMGCEYCNDEKYLLYEADGQHMEHRIFVNEGRLCARAEMPPVFIMHRSCEINYCPMCGRKLKRGA